MRDWSNYIYFLNTNERITEEHMVQWPYKIEINKIEKTQESETKTEEKNTNW